MMRYVLQRLLVLNFIWKLAQHILLIDFSHALLNQNIQKLVSWIQMIFFKGKMTQIVSADVPIGPTLDKIIFIF